MTDPVRVKITDNNHLFNMAETAGLLEAVELLEKLPPQLRGTPGIALAIATIKAEANGRRSAVIGKNLTAIARAGHDIAQHKSVMFDPNTAELICEFYEPDLFGEDPG